MPIVIDSQMPSNLGQRINSNILSPDPVATSPFTYSFTNTAGTILYLMAGLAVNTGGTTSWGTVSYGGVAMTMVFEQTTSTGASRLAFFRLINPPTGSNTVSIGYSITVGGAGHWAIWGGNISLTGVDLSTPEKQSAGTNGTSTNPSIGLSGVLAGNLSIGVAGGGSDLTGQTQTLAWDIAANERTQMSDPRCSTSTATGSVTHGFTMVSDSWAAAAIELAASAPPPVFIQHGRIWPMKLSRQGKRLLVAPSIPVFPAVTTQFLDITAATETDTAVALDKDKYATIGPAATANTAQPLNVDKIKVLGVAAVVNTAQPLTKFKSKLLGPGAETDAAQALDKDKIKTISFASETDAAQAFTRLKSKLLGVATESDVAQALNVDKFIVIIPATETDTAQVLSITHGGGPQLITITPASESDVAQLLTKYKSKALGAATETDAAQAITKSKRVTIIAAVETDSAQALIHLKRLGIATAAETDAAQALTKYKSKTLGVASETDIARPLVFTKTIYKNITPAQEFDVAVPLSIAGETVVIVYRYRGPITLGRF